MPAISVGSVEVDVLPNAQGIRQRMQRQLVPAADEVGEEVGRIIGRHVSTQVAQAIRSGVTQGGRTALPAATRQGQATGSAFARAVRTSVAAALRDLPEIELNADSSDAEREIHQIRAQLTALRDLEIGVDIDAAEASIRISQMQERLQRLSTSDVDVQVRMDTSSAAAQLAAFQAQLARLDGQTARVDVDTSSAVSGMQVLVTAAIAFGPAIIPALPVVAAGLGAIAAAGVAAAAGVGAIGLVAAPAIKGISSALQAQKTAQDAATQSTLSGGQAASQGASKALQMASAQQALATAERNGARQIAQAQQAVRQAKRAAADAVVQAAQRNAQAARQVQDAERSLADAQRDAKRAQEDLTTARAEARQELEDLNSRLADSVLSQRDAELSLREATAERDKVLKSANATELDKERALLAYDQALQRLKDQTTETARLKVETADANKKGVEGSDTVRSAQERLADSQRNVADQARAVKDAQVEAARTQVETARQVADAQQRVSEATANVAVAQQSAADSVASAQRQIASASQSAAGGVDQAAIAQAKYQAELDKLTPSARDTFDAFVDLRSAFGEWSKSLQPKVMPLFTRALNGMRRALPGLTPFATEAADAIGDLQDRASRGFKSPWWKTFKKDLQGSVRPAITGIGVAFGNVFKGMTGVIGAFLPHMDDISGSMQGVTKRFANWGQSLKGSPEFERFLSYSAEMAPRLGDALGKIAGAFLSVGQALAPVSGPLLFLLGGLAEAIGIVAEHAPWLVQGIWLAIVAMRVWTIAQWALNAAMSANPITLIIIGIVALVAIGIYAFNKFPWFRDLVLKAWEGIKTASLWLWNTVLKPFFAWFGQIMVWLWQRIIKPYIGFLIAYWKTVAQVAMWLWNTVLKPFFVWFGEVVVWLWQKIIKPYIGFLIAYWKKVADTAVWLWKTILAPAFRGIGAIISWWWTNIVKRYFGFVRSAISVLGDVFRWLWQKAIKPAWNGISSTISSVWRSGIKPAFDAVRGAVRRVADAFETARKAIKIAWDRLKGIARTPVQYVVDVVYNNGIRGVWNKVAGAFGAKKLDKFTFARGGIMPGYTPGRDVHKFASPTGGQLELSGGEAIMRPEFTRAVGAGFVGTMNRIAKSRGAQGVKAALSPVFGGNPDTPTDTSLRYANGGLVQRFEDGGIFGWIGSAASKAAGAGSAAWNGIKATTGWLGDTLEESARAGVKKVVNPLLKSFPGMDTGFGRMIRKVPDRIIDTLFGYTKQADKKGGGGIGGPKIQAATKWAKTQNGLPYQWGGNGNPSWDCLTLSSVITTPEGHKTLQDLHPGEQVMAYQDGKLVSSKILAKWNTGEQQLFKVRTRNRVLRATAGHRVLVAAPVQRPMADLDERVAMAEWGTEWKHVRDLATSDYLVTYTGSPKEGGEEVPEDLAWLMGLWLADGSVHPNGGIRICVYGDLADKAMSVLRDHSPNRKVSHHPRHGVMVSDIQRSRWMIRNGFCGKSHERFVPPVVMGWSESAQVAFLNGYADGDGSYKGGGTFDTAPLITYKATSYELVEGIREMHLRQGDRVTCTRTEERKRDIYIGGKKIQNARPLHSLDVTRGKGAAQSTGAGHRPGLLRLVQQLKAENMSVQKVLSVEPDGVEETWDIEVEGSHSFVSDGLISHNCSGFMSAIESIIRGQKPHRRWSTHAFKGGTPPGWVKNGQSAFRVGITHAGVGHTAGTVGKTKVESRGGDGVVVGKRARGYNDKLFTSWYGFMPGKYDSGGYLQPGLNLAYNGTGRPEPVFTTAQANALTSMAGRGAVPGPASFEGDLYLDSGEFLGRVRGEAQQVVDQNNGQLLTALGARPTGR